MNGISHRCSRARIVKDKPRVEHGGDMCGAGKMDLSNTRDTRTGPNKLGCNRERPQAQKRRRASAHFTFLPITSHVIKHMETSRG
jgi:hypothetical protein